MTATTKKKKKMGGARPGAGRKPRRPGHSITSTLTISVTEAEKVAIRQEEPGWAREVLHRALKRKGHSV